MPLLRAMALLIHYFTDGSPILHPNCSGGTADCSESIFRSELKADLPAIHFLTFEGDGVLHRVR